jgi:hypothetical protein
MHTAQETIPPLSHRVLAFGHREGLKFLHGTLKPSPDAPLNLPRDVARLRFWPACGARGGGGGEGEGRLHIITTPRGGIPRGVVLRIPPTFPNVTGDSVGV